MMSSPISCTMSVSSPLIILHLKGSLFLDLVGNCLCDARLLAHVQREKGVQRWPQSAFSFLLSIFVVRIFVCPSSVVFSFSPHRSLRLLLPYCSRSVSKVLG